MFGVVVLFDGFRASMCHGMCLLGPKLFHRWAAGSGGFSEDSRRIEEFDRFRPVEFSMANALSTEQTNVQLQGTWEHHRGIAVGSTILASHWRQHQMCLARPTQYITPAAAATTTQSATISFTMATLCILSLAQAQAAPAQVQAAPAPAPAGLPAGVVRLQAQTLKTAGGFASHWPWAGAVEENQVVHATVTCNASHWRHCLVARHWWKPLSHNSWRGARELLGWYVQVKWLWITYLPT